MKLYNVNNVFIQLDEANILNVKEPYNDVSIAGYLEQYAQNLPDSITPQFLKKMQKLLSADERFQYAVRELPQGAPDWAVEAMNKRELVAFVPNQQLNDTIENITHYLSSAFENANQTEDNNVRVAADRELKAFGKVGSIDDLTQRANAYFEALGASKKKEKGAKAGEEAHGMKVIYNVGQGYVWYLLQTAEAYRREGQLLKNCIGSIYTKEKCDREGLAIVVLRKNVSGANEGESIVAARIKNAENSIDEMKGKNNQPPIDKYMPPVLAFVKKFKMTLSGGASHDFGRAGYFYIDGEFVGKEEAVKRALGNPEKVADMGNFTILEKTIPSSLPHEIQRIVRDAFLKNLGWNVEGVTLYFLAQGDKVILTAVVQNRKLMKISHRSASLTDMQINEDEQKPMKKPLAVQFAERLSQLGLISGMSDGLKKSMMWSDNVVFDKKKNEFVPTKVAEEQRGDKTMYGWSKYTDPGMIKSITDVAAHSPADISQYSSNREEELKKVIDPKDVDAVYVNSPRLRDGGAGDDRLGLVDEAIVMFIMKDKRMELRKISIASSDKRVQTTDIVRRTGYRTALTNRRQKLIQSIATIANRHGATIPDTSTVLAGLVRNKEGKLEVFKPKFETLDGTPSGKKLDLTKIPDEQLLPAIFSTLKTAAGRTFHKVEDQDTAAQMIFPSGFNIGDKLAKAMDKVRFEALTPAKQAEEKGLKQWERSQRQIARVEEGKPIQDMAKAAQYMFGNKRPDSIYLTTVQYGRNNQQYEVVMLVKDNKILKVDGSTSAETWQSWNDYERVAEQLNQFAENHKLRFTYQALSNSALRELRVAAGRVTTETEKQGTRAERLERQGAIGREGTDELPFENGAKWVRMTPEEIQQWSRRDNKFAIRGSVWKLVVPKGGVEYVPLAVDVKNDKIVGLFHHGYKGAQAVIDNGNPLPTQKGGMRANKAALAPYVKQAMDTFGWERPKSKTAFQDEGMSRMLQRRFPHENDSFNMQDTTLQRGYADTADIRRAINLGLISYRPAAGRRGLTNYSLTNQGKEVRRAMHQEGAGVDYLDILAPKSVQAGWEKPEPAPLPEPERPARGEGEPRPVRAPGAVRGGTKSEQALQWFTEFTNNNGRIPRRGEFIERMQQDPFGMGAMGAQTYYYNTKKKYEARQAAGQQNESAISKTLNLVAEAKISPFAALFG